MLSDLSEKLTVSGPEEKVLSSDAEGLTALANEMKIRDGEDDGHCTYTRKGEGIGVSYLPNRTQYRHLSNYSTIWEVT